MKLISNSIIITILLLTNSLQLTLKQSQIDSSLTSASSNALAISQGNNYTQTHINSKAIATEGNKAEAASAANASTMNIKNEITGLAKADATSNKYVENEIYKEKTATNDRNINSFNGYQSDILNTDQFEANNKKTITQSDEEIRESQYIAMNTLDQNFRNNIQTINDKSFEMSSLEGVTNNDGSRRSFTQAEKREIVITIDAGDEKLIIEKIIGNDNRVIIVSAAKYLLKSIPQDVKNYFEILYNETCNCKLVNEYAMDLLAEI